jgi:hypothetical protein
MIEFLVPVDAVKTLLVDTAKTVPVGHVMIELFFLLTPMTPPVDGLRCHDCIPVPLGIALSLNP